MTIKHKKQVIKAQKSNYPTYSKNEISNLQKYTEYNRMKSKQKYFYSLYYRIGEERLLFCKIV